MVSLKLLYARSIPPVCISPLLIDGEQLILVLDIGHRTRVDFDTDTYYKQKKTISGNDFDIRHIEAFVPQAVSA